MYFAEVINEYWFKGVSAFLIGFIAVLCALWLFPKLGLMDRPKKYGLERGPIPYYGGLAIFFCFCIGRFPLCRF